MGAAASIGEPVTEAQARKLLNVDDDETDETKKAGREALFLDWWGKLEKNEDGAVAPGVWQAGVSE